MRQGELEREERFRRAVFWDTERYCFSWEDWAWRDSCREDPGRERRRGWEFEGGIWLLEREVEEGCPRDSQTALELGTFLFLNILLHSLLIYEDSFDCLPWTSRATGLFRLNILTQIWCSTSSLPCAWFSFLLKVIGSSLNLVWFGFVILKISRSSPPVSFESLLIF